MKKPNVTWEDLKKKFRHLPRNTPVYYQDPNFGGKYHVEPETYSFTETDGMILIDFPFEEPVD